MLLKMSCLRLLIENERDVKKLHRLRLLPDGRFLYLIETPFMTFPKFSIGSTNEANDDVRILSTCSALWAAEERFNEILNAGGAES